MIAVFDAMDRSPAGAPDLIVALVVGLMLIASSWVTRRKGAR